MSNELSINDIKTAISLFKANYKGAFNDTDEQGLQLLIKSWFCSLKKYPRDEVIKAVQMVVENVRFQPTLADILRQIETIEALGEKTNTELWREIRSKLYTIRELTYKLDYTAKESNGKTQGENALDKIESVFESLSEPLKEYLGNAQSLIDIALIDPDKIGFEENRFQRQIDNCKFRVKNKSNPFFQLIGRDTKSLKDIDDK